MAFHQSKGFHVMLKKMGLGIWCSWRRRRRLSLGAEAVYYNTRWAELNERQLQLYLCLKVTYAYLR